MAHRPMKAAITVGAPLGGIALGGMAYISTGSFLAAAKAAGAVGGVALLLIILLETLAILSY